MRIQRQPVGRTNTSQGSDLPVDAYTLDNGDDLAVTVWTYGATLVEVRTPGRDNRTDNVVVRLPGLGDYEDRERNAYIGATVGRYCRCVRDGRMVLDGVPHQLARNEGPHHVHGGGEGFDRRVWDAEAGRDGDELVLRLRLESPDGDQGYPGAVTAETVYRVDREAGLTIEFSGTTTAPTVFGLTNHAFWNLAGQGTVDGHQLAINSSSSVFFDAEQMPLAGPPADIRGTRLDYQSARGIGAEELDNFFVLDDPWLWAAQLHDPGSGRLLEIRTEGPGMGVYSGDKMLTPRAGLALEPGCFPDAPNRSDYPSARLDPGGTRTESTIYRFSVVP
ncbi:aldose epimerase family protein [Streptomyces sp. SCSIO ZS0520]|uniref:aldose epimerase family protein n=1 Tax=Streptomyces sp. SCSIO ZS0520 TaxID=2892996 RepID=UPI0021DAB6AA|nr:aldose epimerase family protein [Streptomyces sp. SCSIO ZS0520]